MAIGKNRTLQDVNHQVYISITGVQNVPALLCYVGPIEKAISVWKPHPSIRSTPTYEVWEGKHGSLHLRSNGKKLLKY